MKLVTLAPNVHELRINGVDVTFSYETPIAVANMNGDIAIQTSKKFSATTTRHQNKHVPANWARVSQDTLEMAISHLYSGHAELAVEVISSELRASA